MLTNRHLRTRRIGAPRSFIVLRDIAGFLVATAVCCALPVTPISSAEQPAARGPRASDEPLPGLVTAPRNLPGVGRRWQLARVLPRGLAVGVAWNGDGTRIAYSDDTYVRICDAQSFETQKFLAGHADAVTCVAWNHRTNLIASSSCDGTVRIWSGAGVPQGVVKLDAGEIRSVAWTGDGSRLAAAGSKGVVYVWNADGSARKSIPVSKAPVNAVAWSPDKTKLITGDDDGQVKLWSVEGKLVRACDGHLTHVTAVGWSADGQRFASSSYGAQEPSTERIHADARIFAKDGTTVATISREEPCGSLCWSPNSQKLAVLTTEQNVWIYDVRGNELERIATNVTSSNLPSGIDWSPKEPKVVVGGIGVIAVASLDPRSTVASTSGAASFFTSVPPPLALPSPDQTKCLVRLISDEAARVWSTADGTPGAKFPEFDGEKIRELLWSPDGDQVAFVEAPDRLRVWHVGAPSAPVALQTGSPLGNLVWSPGGESLAAVDQKGTLRVVKVDGTKVFEGKVAQPAANPAPQRRMNNLPSKLLFSADGKSVASVEVDAVEIVPLGGGQVQSLPYEKSMPGGWGNNFWWSADGRRMTSFRKQGRVNSQLVTWDVATGKRTTSTVFSDEVSAFDCSRDGKLIALGFDTGFWQVRNLDDLDAAPIESEPGVHFSTIRGVGFSNDGRRFATGGWDGLIKIWSTDGTLLQTLRGNDWPVHILTWSKDDQRLMSIARDRTTIIWSLKSGRPELRCEMTRDRGTTLLAANGLFYGPSVPHLDHDFVALVEKANGEMEIVSYADFLARTSRR
jgi:WD40 repeat protein